MTTIAPIPNTNTPPTTAVNNTASSNPQVTAPQAPVTTAKGNLSTDHVPSTVQPTSTTAPAPVTTYVLNASPLQTSAGSTANQPTLTVDNANNILGFLMTVMADLGINIRKANMESRQLDLQNQISALLSQVKQLQDSAKKTLDSAMTNAIVGAVMGAISLAVGSMALKTTLGASKNINAMKDPAQADQFAYNKQRAEFKVGVGQSLTQMGNTLNTLATSVASAFASNQKFDADMAAAMAQQFAAIATEMGAKYEQSNTFAANAMQAFTAALQTAKAMSDAVANNSQNFNRNMV